MPEEVAGGGPSGRGPGAKSAEPLGEIADGLGTGEVRTDRAQRIVELGRSARTVRGVTRERPQDQLVERRG